MLTLTALIWGTAFVAQRVGNGYVGPAAFNAARFFIGGISLLPVMLIKSVFDRKNAGKGTPAEGVPRALLAGGLCCGIMLSISSLLQQNGIVYTTAGKAGFITALYIIIVPILGILLGRKVRMHMWGCVLAAIIGMDLLCIRESISLNRGDAMILACAFSYSVHILLVDHFSPLVDGVKLSCIQFFACAFLSLIFALILEKPDLSSVWAARMPLLYTGVLSSGVGFTLQILGQRDVNPVVASLLMSLESVFAAIAGWFILQETLSKREAGGCALILAATLMAQIPGILKNWRSAAQGAQDER
jgi:drug/metabolite transporter (DMT)-like permease